MQHTSIVQHFLAVVVLRTLTMLATSGVILLRAAAWWINDIVCFSDRANVACPLILQHHFASGRLSCCTGDVVRRVHSRNSSYYVHANAATS
jgi:hypothetical protein